MPLRYPSFAEIFMAIAMPVLGWLEVRGIDGGPLKAGGRSQRFPDKVVKPDNKRSSVTVKLQRQKRWGNIVGMFSHVEDWYRSFSVG
jgi:hypothetical protein